MKAIFEGSPDDIRKVLADPNAGYNEARATLLAEYNVNEAARLRETNVENQRKIAAADRLIMAAEKKASDANATAFAAKTELGAKNAHIASQDAEIQKLQFETRALRSRLDDPIRLTAEQETEVEALYQQTIETYKMAPLFFPGEGNSKVSAEQWIIGIFKLLASGNRVQAIREIRLNTGLSLIKGRDMIDDALRAFGCVVNDKNSPVTLVKPAPKQEPVKPLNG
jgi:ribosomal protein L7/L12